MISTYALNIATKNNLYYPLTLHFPFATFLHQQHCSLTIQVPLSRVAEGTGPTTLQQPGEALPRC